MAAQRRCLVLGLGAVGTYVGAQIAATGVPVTFLVRKGKVENGLLDQKIFVTCPKNEFEVTNVEIVDTIDGPYDLVIVACKTFQLAEAIETIKSGVGQNTIIIPLLNGTTHIRDLEKDFQPGQVWGGLAHFSVVKHSSTHVERLSPNDIVIAGSRDGNGSEFVSEIFKALSEQGMESRISDRIDYEMWEKWTFIVTLAGMTSLMRGASGEVTIHPAGEKLARTMFREASAVASAAGHTPNPEFVLQSLDLLMNQNLFYKASLLRDIENGYRTEVQALMSNFVDYARKYEVDCPHIELATLHILIHETRVMSDNS